MTGYSGTPLSQKLGVKPGATVIALNPPENYVRLLAPLPERVKFSNRLTQDCLFVHLFTQKRAELERYLCRLRPKISDTGVAWISWPKKAAKIETDVTEDVIRAVALPLGFVDTKVCAVDETWSGLKLMVRRENRKESGKK
jgi:hypothetical protein